MKEFALLCTLLLCGTLAFTPYVPTAGWTYYLEASRGKDWPQCQYRFASYPTTCDKIDLWLAAGINQQFTFLPTPFGNDTFYLRTSCGKYLSYPSDCANHIIDTWPLAGINQEFKFSPTNFGPFEYSIEAVGRKDCNFRWIGFPTECSSEKPDSLFMWNSVGTDQNFRIHPVQSSSPIPHKWNSETPCPDPFAWFSSSKQIFELVCTGGKLALLNTTSVGPNAVFLKEGNSISGEIPTWAKGAARWAPENVEVKINQKTLNFLFFSDAQNSDGKHRVGWVVSDEGSFPGKWNKFSSDFLDLGLAPGGEIDEHVFFDSDSNKYFLVWKTDDNSVGMLYTRIWAQEVVFLENNLKIVGNKLQLLDSTGLWWSDSWVDGGSLIEGPEIIKQNGFYYLFFASGKYCTTSYTEGVARSKNLLGPYEKMLEPLLSTGIVGKSKGQKLIGPGHATFVQDSSKNWVVIWHASIVSGDSCEAARFPFASYLQFRDDGWPFVEF